MHLLAINILQKYRDFLECIVFKFTRYFYFTTKLHVRITDRIYQGKKKNNQIAFQSVDKSLFPA